MIPNTTQRTAIAAKGLVPVRSVTKAYQHPERCRSITLERVRRAAEELGLPPPGLAREASSIEVQQGAQGQPGPATARRTG